MVHAPFTKRTFEIDDENIYHEHIIKTDWPYACEITSLDDEYHITTVKLDTLDDMNPVVNELRRQGWGLEYSSTDGAVMVSSRHPRDVL